MGYRLIEMKETKHKTALSIFVVAIIFVVMLPTAVSSAEQDIRLLEIIEDSETAAVEWRTPYTGEALPSLPSLLYKSSGRTSPPIIETPAV